MESKKDRFGIVFRVKYSSVQNHCCTEPYEIYQFQQITFLVYYVTAIEYYFLGIIRYKKLLAIVNIEQHLKEIEHLDTIKCRLVI